MASSYTDSEKHLMEGSGNGAFPLKGS